MNKPKAKIIQLLKENKFSEAEELARLEGFSTSEWESILNDYFWDWHTEH
jgi:hypothetical protein